MWSLLRLHLRPLLLEMGQRRDPRKVSWPTTCHFTITVMRTVKHIGEPRGFVFPRITIYLKSEGDNRESSLDSRENNLTAADGAGAALSGLAPDIYFYVSQEHGDFRTCAAIMCTANGENLHMTEAEFMTNIKPFEPKAIRWRDGRVCLRFLEDHTGTEEDMLRLLSENPAVEFPLSVRDIYYNPDTAMYRAERMRLFLTQDHGLTLTDIRARFDDLFPPCDWSPAREFARRADATDIPPPPSDNE